MENMKKDATHHKIENSFIDKWAVIVGGSSGIGAAIAELLSSAGCHLILVGRNSRKLEMRAKTLRNAKIIQGDISELSEHHQLIMEISSYTKQIDYLVISSGIFMPLEFDQITESDWDCVLNTNLKGPFFLTQQILPLLKKGLGKSIVFISSALAHVGATESSSYCASKGGVSALVRALAVELAPIDIRVNAISPGHVDTPMIKDLLTSNESRNKIRQQYPLNRIGKASDVAHLVSFLLSNHAEWITGVDYSIDGGRSAQG